MKMQFFDSKLFKKTNSTYCAAFWELQVRFRIEVSSLELQTPLMLVASVVEVEAVEVVEANLTHQCTLDSWRFHDQGYVADAVDLVASSR